MAYREVRDKYFQDGLSRMDITREDMRKMVANLRTLSGQYQGDDLPLR